MFFSVKLINTKQFSVYYQGPNVYNSLDSDIAGANSIISIKEKLKSFQHAETQTLSAPKKWTSVYSSTLGYTTALFD